MSKHSYLATAIATVLSIYLSTAPSSQADVSLSHNVKLAQRDPKTATNDANRDFTQGMCLLYATGGYTWMLIGTHMSVSEAEAKYTIFYDTQTSDVISDKDADVQNRARAYAEAYNRVAVKNCGKVR